MAITTTTKEMEMKLPQEALDKIMDLADGLYTEITGKVDLIETERDDVLDRIQDMQDICDMHMDSIFDAVNTPNDSQFAELIKLSQSMVDELTDINEELDAMNDGDYYNL